MNLINQIQNFLLSDSELFQTMEQLQFKDGETLFKQDDSEVAFYWIQSGQIQIYQKAQNNQEVYLKTLHSSQTLGQLALIDNQPHSVTAISLGSSNLLRLNRQNFLKRVSNSPELSQLLIQLGNQRLSCLVDYIKRLEDWMHLVAESHCGRVIDDLDDFEIQGEGLVKSGYLVGTLTTVADSFKDIVQTVQQLKGQECQLEIKLKLELDEHKHQQQVEEVVNADYFNYLVELAERRNTIQ